MAYLALTALKKPMANLFPVKTSCSSESSEVFLFKCSKLPQILIKDFNAEVLVIDFLHTDAVTWSYQPVLFNS